MHSHWYEDDVPYSERKTRLHSVSLAKGCCKTPILQILSVDPVISWSKGARCCFELPALTGNLAKSDRLRWLIGLLSGWTNIARRPRTVEDHRCERSSTSPIEFRATDNRGSGRARRGFSTSIQPLARAGNLPLVVQGGWLTKTEEQTHPCPAHDCQRAPCLHR